MRKKHIKALLYCFICYVLLQLIQAIARFMFDCNLSGMYNFRKFASFFYITTLALSIIVTFVLLKGVKMKDLYSAGKEILKRHWIKYALIILIVFSLASNSLLEEGVLAEKITMSSFFSNPSLTARFLAICILELFMSEEATIFFIFVPFICHVIVYVKSKEKSKIE